MMRGDAGFREQLRLGSLLLLDLGWPDPRPADERRRWFRRGLATTLAGARRALDAEGEWRYEFAGVPEFAWLPRGKEIIGFERLIDAKDDSIPSPEEDALAGLLVHFLSSVVIEGDRVVLGSDARGRTPNHAAGWNRFVPGALVGKDSVADFRRAFGVVDDAAFASLGSVFDRYRRWIHAKLELHAASNGGIVAWDAQRNRRGQVVGEPQDDLLPPAR